MSRFTKKWSKINMPKPLVSIVIVSFNTKDLLKDCLHSIEEFSDVPVEVIISDNGSTDGTIEYLKKFKTKIFSVTLLENNSNLGFAKGNNAAKSYANGKYVLFLNPDTILRGNVLSQTVDFLEENKDVAAITPKVVLPNGELDKDTRRTFPTPFVALTHFSGLDRLFPKSKLFSKYWYGYLREDETHEIEALQGAYFLIKKDVLDKVFWFDEDYFLDGEDIDLCFKIHDAGYRIYYYPKVSILHIKKGSKSKNRSLRSIVGGVKAMEIFYRKRMWSRYPLPLNLLVLLGIKILVFIRTAKYYLKP